MHTQDQLEANLQTKITLLGLVKRTPPDCSLVGHMTFFCMGGSKGVQGVRTPSGRKCLFSRRVKFSMFVNLLLKTPKKALVHCTKPKFPPEKALVHCTKPNIFSRKKNAFFYATRKDVEYYSQMPGKRILVLELSNFSGRGFGASRLRRSLAGAVPPPPCVSFFRSCPPFQKSDPGSAPAISIKI
jgi:hypothetical protein